MSASAVSAPLDEDRVYGRVTRRLIPFLFLCYVAAYLDRVNVSFAKLTMAVDLNFSDTIYGFGAGVFFFGYFLFEVPSNLWMHRIGARLTLSRIMILWGLISAAMMFVTTPTQFYVMRFLLGAAEAGFFPGVVLYLTYWYPASRRGRVQALFVTAVAISGVVGNPLSGWIMSSTHGTHGLAGWQWLFLLEGLPSVALGLFALYWLDDGVADARWLSPAERALIESPGGAMRTLAASNLASVLLQQDLVDDAAAILDRHPPPRRWPGCAIDGSGCFPPSIFFWSAGYMASISGCRRSSRGWG